MGNLSTYVTHGFKTALSAVLAYAITQALGLEFGYWAVITTVIVMQVYVADSVEMCLYRFFGTILGAILGALVLLAMPRTPIFTGIALFVCIGICSFLTRYNTRYRMAAITVVIIVTTGLNVQDVAFFALFRVFEICIGIFCAFVVSVLVFPKRKVDVLKTKLEKQAMTCADQCRDLVAAFTSNQQHVGESVIDELAKDVWGNHGLLHKISQHESLIYRKKFNEHFGLKITVIGRSVEHLRNMTRALNSLADNGCDIILARELETLAEKSGKALVMCVKNKPWALKYDLEQLVSELDAKFLHIRKQGLIRRFDSEKLIQVFSFYSSLRYFTADVLYGIDALRLSGPTGKHSHGVYHHRKIFSLNLSRAACCHLQDW